MPARRTFVVVGAASAQLPLRILGLFAQRDLLPTAVAMTRAGGDLALRIDDDALDPAAAAIILAKIAALPEVASATLEDFAPSTAPPGAAG